MEKVKNNFSQFSYFPSKSVNTVDEKKEKLIKKEV